MTIMCKRTVAEQRVEELQRQLTDTQKLYQKEVSKLEKEVKDLRQQLLLRQDPKSSHKVQVNVKSDFVLYEGCPESNLRFSVGGVMGWG